MIKGFTSNVMDINDCDGKSEVVEVIENVIQHKEGISNGLDESKSI